MLHSPTPTPTETIPPTPPKPPPADACYRLGYDEVLAPTSDKKPVPCTGIHTAVTFYVGSYDKHLAVDGDAGAPARVDRLPSPLRGVRRRHARTTAV